MVLVASLFTFLVVAVGRTSNHSANNGDFFTSDSVTLFLGVMILVAGFLVASALSELNSILKAQVLVEKLDTLEASDSVTGSFATYHITRKGDDSYAITVQSTNATPDFGFEVTNGYIQFVYRPDTMSKDTSILRRAVSDMLFALRQN